MKRILIAAVMGLMTATTGHAACYADYKAKQDDPLRLHYGVGQVSDDNCSKKAAARELAGRLESAGWTLLNILSVFGDEGLDERKSSAGDYFLRF